MATIQPATELICIRKVGDIVHTFHKHAHIKCGNQIDQQLTRPPLVSMGTRLHPQRRHFLEPMACERCSCVAGLWGAGSFSVWSTASNLMARCLPTRPSATGTCDVPLLARIDLDRWDFGKGRNRCCLSIFSCWRNCSEASRQQLVNRKSGQCQYLWKVQGTNRSTPYDFSPSSQFAGSFFTSAC